MGRSDANFLSFNYNLEDYPFKKMLEQQKKEMKLLIKLSKEMSAQTYGDTIGKRVKVEEGREDQSGEDDSNSESSDVDCRKPHKKLVIPTVLAFPSAECKGGKRAPGRALKHNLSEHQSKTLEFFNCEITQLIKQTSGARWAVTRDDDLLILLAMRQLVVSYFYESAGSSGLQTLLTRHVMVNDMIGILAGVKFRDKSEDMIIVHLRQYLDTFLDVIVDRRPVRSLPLHLKPGKSFLNVFLFLAKTWLQQLHTVRHLYAEAACPRDRARLLSADSLDVAAKLSEVILEMLALDNSGKAVSSGQQSSKASGFQFHMSAEAKSQRQQVEGLSNTGQKLPLFGDISEIESSAQ